MNLLYWFYSEPTRSILKAVRNGTLRCVSFDLDNNGRSRAYTMTIRHVDEAVDVKIVITKTFQQGREVKFSSDTDTWMTYGEMEKVFDLAKVFQNKVWAGVVPGPAHDRQVFLFDKLNPKKKGHPYDCI